MRQTSIRIGHRCRARFKLNFKRRCKIFWLWNGLFLCVLKCRKRKYDLHAIIQKTWRFFDKDNTNAWGKNWQIPQADETKWACKKSPFQAQFLKEVENWTYWIQEKQIAHVWSNVKRKKLFYRSKCLIEYYKCCKTKQDTFISIYVKETGGENEPCKFLILSK